MGKVTLNITMSLDGFVTGLIDGIDNSLGDGGTALQMVLQRRYRGPNIKWQHGAQGIAEERRNNEGGDGNLWGRGLGQKNF